MAFDAGAVRIINTGGSPIVVSDVSVQVGADINDLWNLGGDFTIPVGGSAILTQTSQFNFDTSDQAGQVGLCCINNGVIPTVTITVSGQAAVTFSDTAQVLNTNGSDFACSTPGCSTNESFAWRDIGTFGGQAGVPEPTSLLLLGTGLAGVASAIRRRGSSK